MKIVQTLKKHLPVSRNAHTKALAATQAKALAENAYLLGQLKQVTAANVRLEAKLHQQEDLEG